MVWCDVMRLVCASSDCVCVCQVCVCVSEVCADPRVGMVEDQAELPMRAFALSLCVVSLGHVFLHLPPPHPTQPQPLCPHNINNLNNSPSPPQHHQQLWPEVMAVLAEGETLQQPWQQNPTDADVAPLSPGWRVVVGAYAGYELVRQVIQVR